MTIAKFKVYSSAMVFGRHRGATVTINRANNLVNVRPLRRKRTYEMRLEDVAQWICEQIVMAELAEKKRQKKLKKKGGLFGR